MSHDSELMAKSVKSTMDNNDKTVDLPEHINTSERFIAWARSRPVIYVSEGNLEHAMSNPDDSVDAIVNHEHIFGTNPVPLFLGPQKVEFLEVTDSLVANVCKVIREKKGITDIAMAAYVINAVKDEVKRKSQEDNHDYSRSSLADAVFRVIPGYHNLIDTLGMPRKVEIAGYHLFMAGDVDSDDARTIRAAAEDLNNRGCFQFSDDQNGV